MEPQQRTTNPKTKTPQSKLFTFDGATEKYKGTLPVKLKKEHYTAKAEKASVLVPRRPTRLWDTSARNFWRSSTPRPSGMIRPE